MGEHHDYDDFNEFVGMFWLVIIFAMIFSFGLWDAFWNMPKKFEILEEYANNGVGAMGIVLDQKITRHYTYCFETRKTYRLCYAYKQPGTNRVCVKEYVRSIPGWCCCCCFCCCGQRQQLPVIRGRLVVVNVLSNHPRSGQVQSIVVDQRHELYGSEIRRSRIFRCLIGILLCCYPMAAFICFPDDMSSIWNAYGIVVTVVLILGFLCGTCLSLAIWRHSTLEACLEERYGSQAQALERTEAVEEGHAMFVGNASFVGTDATYAPVATAEVRNAVVAVADEDCHAAPAAAVLSVVGIDGEERGLDLAEIVVHGQVANTDDSGIEVVIPDPLAQKIVDEARDHSSFETLFNALNSSEEEAWDQRASYLHLAAEHWRSMDLKQCPDNAVGNLIKGVYLAYRAARDSSAATNSSPLFYIGMRDARDALLRSAEQDPKDPTPYAFLVSVVAKKANKDLAREWFEAAIRRDPDNQMAHFGFMQYLCPKQGYDNNNEEMFDFARETVRKAPKGSFVKSILFAACYERWLYLFTTDEAASAMNLLSDETLREETMAIYKELLENHEIRNVSDCRAHAAAAEWLLLLNEAWRTELEKLRPWRKVLPMSAKLLHFALQDPDKAERLVVESLHWQWNAPNESA